MMRQFRIVSSAASCNGNGVCEAQEDCISCPSDCKTSSGAICGNGMCETGAGDGEDCVSCPADCAGNQTGGAQFCCGALSTGTSAAGAVACSDARCTASGYRCNDAPGGMADRVADSVIGH